MTRLRSILLVSATLVLGTMSFACNRVRVSEVRGPDGNDWKKISCRHLDSRCYRTAERMCPNGYYFAYADASGAPVREPPKAEEQEPQASGVAAPPERGKNTTDLPPRSEWGHDMYSWQRGTILVKCADATARY